MNKQTLVLENLFTLLTIGILIFVVIGIYKNIKDWFNIPGAFKDDLFMIFMCTIAASIPFIIKFLFF